MKNNTKVKSVSLFIRGLLLLAVLVPLSVGATQVDGLYRANVDVADQSAQTRQSAVRAGLSEVLIKVTGKTDVLAHPVIKSGLESANDYLSEFSYQQYQPEPGSSAQLTISISYAEGAVDQLLRIAKLPVWAADRPDVLVWIVTDVPNKGATYISEQLMPAVRGFAKKRAQVRGIPVVQPFVDLEDQLIIPAKTAWAFDERAMKSAAERYDVKNWAVVRFYQTSTGQYRGAVFVQAGERRDVSTIEAGKIDTLIKKGIDKVADHVSHNLGYVQQETSSGMLLSMEGISNYQRYSDLFSYFDQLKVVADVRVVEVNGDRLTLDFTLDGSETVFLDTLRREKNFMEVVDFNDTSAVLRFMWQP